MSCGMRYRGKSDAATAPLDYGEGSWDTKAGNKTTQQGGRTMALHLKSMALGGLALLLATQCFAQGPTDNPYRPVRGLADGGGPSVPGGEWARLPGGREMGPPASVHVDIDGESIWAFIR